MTLIRAIQADITTLDVDAIVNAANSHLQHGGGVALAIARAGGPTIQEESDRWVELHGPLTPGTAAVTSAGTMPSGHVIHVAGPIFREDQDNEALLRAAVTAALAGAADQSCGSVALPSISAGIYGYPQEQAAGVIVQAVRAWTGDHPEVLDEVVLVGYTAGATESFRSAISALP